MIEWIDPGFLGPQKEFTQKYVGPISDGLWADSSYDERRLSLKMLKVLKNEISVKINRAGIDAIKDVMPPKTEFMITVPLTSVQDAMYRRLVLLPSIGHLSVSLRNKVCRNYETVFGTGLHYDPRLRPVAVAHLQSSGNLCQAHRGEADNGKESCCCGQWRRQTIAAARTGRRGRLYCGRGRPPPLAPQFAAAQQQLPSECLGAV